MRVVKISAVGTAFAYLTFSYSQAASGFPQASAFMMAILLATLTVGLAVAAGSHTLPEDIGAYQGSRSGHPCHGCGSPMVEVHSVWVCGRCDRMPDG
ncbi:MAG: hypothetical protein HKN80_13015 [Acidimicrobiia bacterium]|nr:hypothetical protein [Acidimicrobiia bacterium]